MRLTHYLLAVATALTVTVTAAPVEARDASAAASEDAYLTQFLAAKRDAEAWEAAEKREEMYPIQYLGVKDEKEKREEMYPIQYLGVKDEKEKREYDARK
ncbi:hypothetical protein MMC11_005850 [Xylographa trunciseda]|nr:hypothetical protein [Xylographa trunciseda]